MGKVANSPLPYGGSPTLWSRGTKSEVTHQGAVWLHHASRLRGAQGLEAGDKISSGPHDCGLATKLRPSGGWPTPQSKRQY